MSSFFSSYPFLGFGLWTCFALCLALLIVAIIDRHGEIKTRRQVDTLFILGGIGGMIIINLHDDFFAPAMLFKLIQVGGQQLYLDAFIFGGSFLALVSILPLFALRSRRYEPEQNKSISRERKVMALLLPFIAGGATYALGSNSIGVVSAAYFAGGYAMVWWRRDLLGLALESAALSLVSYVALLISYLLFLRWLGVEVAELARAYSPYYASYGDKGTFTVLVLLILWSLTFGFMFGPFWPFMTNKDVVCPDHPYRHELNDDDPVSSGFEFPSVSSGDDPD